MESGRFTKITSTLAFAMLAGVVVFAVTAVVVARPGHPGGPRPTSAAGSWNTFVGNAGSFSAGAGPNTAAYDFAPQEPPPMTSNGVIISELRTSGPGGAPGDAAGGEIGVTMASGRRGNVSPVGAPGQIGDLGDAPPVVVNPREPPPCCDGDEYVELYNTAETDIEVLSSDGSSGWALVKRGETCLVRPEVIAVIPNGTIIPARGHYLLVGNEYSLGGYAAGNGTTATADQLFDGTIEGDRSVALFNTSDTTNFTQETRLDAVGFDAGSGNTCELLAEGTKLPPPRNSTAEYAFVRKIPGGVPSGGVPQDTNDNAADFALVSTTPQVSVGDNPQPVLGAPGPENKTSPVRRNDSFSESPLAPDVARNAPPNRERRFDVEPCSDQGSLLVRRTFTNNTEGDVTRLRFRLVDITTFNSPGYSPDGPQADLRVRDSQNETLFIAGRGTIQVHGLTREQPPAQPEPTCGGLNTSLSDGQITLSAPVAPGATADVVFRFGIMKTGGFRVFVILEALP